MGDSASLGVSSPDSLRAVCAAFQYEFRDPQLLQDAFLHRSWQSENDAERSNERLEFLGDAVLGWVVADIAYRQFSELPEGRLTDLRKSVVNATALARIARGIHLGDALLLGKGEDAAVAVIKPRCFLTPLRQLLVLFTWMVEQRRRFVL